jgi:hypothetical protein
MEATGNSGSGVVCSGDLGKPDALLPISSPAGYPHNKEALGTKVRVLGCFLVSFPSSKGPTPSFHGSVP